MNHTTENSAPRPGVVIEVVGPLLDDQGLLARTLAEVLVEERVVLRPGAVDQVAGAAVDWSLTTLLEGHGRFELLERVPELERRVVREWERLVPSGLVRRAPGALHGWRRALESDLPILLLFGGPAELVVSFMTGLGLGMGHQVEIVGSGARGIPRPDSLMEWLSRRELTSGEVHAAVRSSAAASAAAGAHVADLVQIGAVASGGMALPTDRVAPDLGEFLDMVSYT